MKDKLKYDDKYYRVVKNCLTILKAIQNHKNVSKN